MKLTIQNINKIEFAEIKVNGLTVIAGTNDSGKSTVGKTLFSVVKALANSTDNSKTIVDTLKRKLDTLYRSLIKLDLLYKTSLESMLPLRNSMLKKMKSQKGSDKTIQQLEDLSVAVENSEFNPSHKASVNRQIAEIKDLILEGNTPGSILKRETQAILEVEFMKSVCSYDTKSSEILFSDESGNDDFLVKLSQDRIIDLSGGNRCFFEDVTLIESPLYLHLIDVLASAQTFNEESERNTIFTRFVPQVNYHIKDIAQKLYNFRFSVANTLFHTDETRDIDTITGGHFGFDEDNKQLFWEKDQRRFQVVNVASGIKSFGMMQMLESTNCINEKRILIWDEPENHLHPEWQIRLAELLVGMAKKGIPILITSHSPYFIQAIRYFSNKMEMDKFVFYYMADETSRGTCRMTEYTDDLNTIFYKLAEPMNRIINLGR